MSSVSVIKSLMHTCNNFQTKYPWVVYQWARTGVLYKSFCLIHYWFAAAFDLDYSLELCGFLVITILNVNLTKQCNLFFAHSKVNLSSVYGEKFFFYDNSLAFVFLQSSRKRRVSTAAGRDDYSELGLDDDRRSMVSGASASRGLFTVFVVLVFTQFISWTWVGGLVIAMVLPFQHAIKRWSIYSMHNTLVLLMPTQPKSLNLSSSFISSTSICFMTDICI